MRNGGKHANIKRRSLIAPEQKKLTNIAGRHGYIRSNPYVMRMCVCVYAQSAITGLDV